jgi:UDP-N-acetylmuramoylalanine--D-glutamate ligase
VRGLDGSTVSIIGLGASGEAAARLAAYAGAHTYVSDLQVEPATSARAADLREHGVDVELGRHDLERVASSSLVVASPGIPTRSGILRDLQQRGVHWISEPELAFRFFRAPLIAVTGTNGKTTTAAMTAHLLEAGGRVVGLGGNIGAGLGPPASALAMLPVPPDWYVLEVSSFQLGAVERFRPDIGVVTNLAPDHLDRYETVDAYYADKAHLFDTADDSSRWVLDADPAVSRLAGSAMGIRYEVRLDGPVERGGFLVGDVLTVALGEGDERLATTTQLPVIGRHNVKNALMAALSARLAGAAPEAVSRGLRTFHALPHRLEPVGEKQSVTWVNDSKATNVAATRSALLSLDRTLVILLGGVDKGEDFRPLAEPMRGRVRAAVVYGAVRDRLAAEIGDATEVVTVDGSFEDAVGAALERALPGDVLLLSPATASFDMFDNYEARGRRFTELAQED